MYCFVFVVLFCFVFRFFCITCRSYAYAYYLLLSLHCCMRFEYLAAAHKLIHDETEKTAKLFCRFKTQVQY